MDFHTDVELPGINLNEGAKIQRAPHRCARSSEVPRLIQRRKTIEFGTCRRTYKRNWGIWVSVKMGYTPKLPYIFLFNGEDVDNPLGVVYFQTKPQKQPRNRNHNVFEKQLGKSKPILLPASYLGFESSISDYFRRVLQS